MASLLDVRVGWTGDRVHIVPAGELDLSSVELLTDALAGTDHCRRLTLDLRELRFIDSTGLRLILKTREWCGERLWLIRGPAMVQRVFELTRTDEVLRFVDAEAGIDEEPKPAPDESA